VSDFGVYEDDMSIKRFSDAEVERLLTGQAPENPELAQLGSALAAVHVVDLVEPSDESVSRFASEAAAIALLSVSTGPASKPTRRRGALTTLHERLATVAVAVFVLAGMSGIAVAADAAAPGDPLYGIDRALERVGINDGAAEERLAEAGALVSRGQVTEAMGHAATAIEEPSDDDRSAASASHAATALREAAVSVGSGDEEPSSEEVQIAVSAMLAEMATLLGDPDLDGAEFGRRVSEMARSIGRHDDTDGEAPGTNLPDESERGRPDDTGPPENTPGGPPDEAPGGPPGGAEGSPGGGPPSNTPEKGGPPDGAGRP
jgi:hypothetical protein